MKKKKLISALLAIVILLSCVTLASNAFAKTNQDIGLDIVYVDSTSGLEDKIWYTYTPSVSGTYMFISYSVGYNAEAYLFTKENNFYTQLAYSDSDDDYSTYSDLYGTYNFNGTTYTHQSYGFRLTYNLEAGTKYYFAAGRNSNSTSTTSEMRVRLTCYKYDSTEIADLKVSCDAGLTWYTDGDWRTDSDGESYYYYNYSKIIQNMTVTLIYKDGTQSSASASTGSVDGFDISFKQNQTVNHWYNVEDENYTGNILTVSVCDKSVDYNVVIDQGALYAVTGVVVDYFSNEPVKGASICVGNNSVATTDSNGKFTFTYAPGAIKITVKAANAIQRTVSLSVDVLNTSNNDHSSNPIPIVCDDYVADGTINGKDYVYMVKNGLTTQQNRFNQIANFNTDSYEAMTL